MHSNVNTCLCMVMWNYRLLTRIFTVCTCTMNTAAALNCFW